MAFNPLFWAEIVICLIMGNAGKVSMVKKRENREDSKEILWGRWQKKKPQSEWERTLKREAKANLTKASGKVSNVEMVARGKVVNGKT